MRPIESCAGRPSLLFMRIGVRQQRHETCTLDRLCQLTLILGAGASNAAGNDLAGFSDVVFQQFQIFVINLLNTFCSETAEFSAAIKTRHEYSPIKALGLVKRIASKIILPVASMALGRR